MKNTGERHIISESITDKAELYNHLMHIATYKFAQPYAEGKHILDFGCGSGYGSFGLSKVAKQVTAVDISAEAVEYAATHYTNKNLKYCLITDLKDETFDVITSFQVIEHVSNDRKYLETLKKHLKTGGCLLLSTPDKSVRLYRYIQKPWNIFHLKEYTTTGLYNLLSGYFTHIEILKIGSDRDFVLNEIHRCLKQKRITLPCTLFFYPYFVRVGMLKLQRGIYRFLVKVRKTPDLTKVPVSINNSVISEYSTDDIKFDNKLTHTTDILVICRK